MIRVVDWIAVRAHNQDQFDYAKMLGNLVTEYEVSQKRKTKLRLAGLELLRAVTESSGMRLPMAGLEPARPFRVNGF